MLLFGYFVVTQFTFIIVLTMALLAYAFYRSNKKKQQEMDLLLNLREPPIPRGLPVIGHLHLMGKYEVPYQAFTDLGKEYGDVVRLKLGFVRTIVVNGQDAIKEVLVTKSDHFDCRPNFKRYQMLFSGNKQNSLAFCDYSDLQKVRRDMLKTYTFPRAFTHKFHNLETIIVDQTDTLLTQIDSHTNIKQCILHVCANIFTNHFCSKNFDSGDIKFRNMLEDFDEIFYEVNQGYAADFLPFLMFLHYKHLRHINKLAHNIRTFILEHIIGDRFAKFGNDNDPADYVETLIKHVKYAEETDFSWETALFALEDIIGGHAAVANFLVKLLGYLVNEPEVQRKIQEEIDYATSNGDKFRSVSISDRSMMPYTDGAILEAIRLIASPVVPRVANQDSSINGFKVKKGDTIFVNNYEISMSETLWNEPKKFKPERFIQENNNFQKPDFFLPFGGGTRSCMGYRMVQLVSLGIISTILQNYTILPLEGENYKVPVGSLALPKKTYEFKFEKRSINIT